MNQGSKTDSNVLSGTESNGGESGGNEGSCSPSRRTGKRFKKGKWTREEDETLKKIVAVLGERKWKKISEFVTGRSPIQCLHRWNKILKPGLVKGPWSAEEDQQLTDWVRKEGPRKWSLCSKLIPGRSGKQCRERWLNNLNPVIKRGNWTEPEDELLFKLFMKHGSSWSKIAKHFDGRTENCIKNRFYSTMRKVKAAKVKKEHTTTTTVMSTAREEEETKEVTGSPKQEKLLEVEQKREEERPCQETVSQAGSVGQRDKLCTYLSNFLQKMENPPDENTSNESGSHVGGDQKVPLRERTLDDVSSRPRKRVCTDESIKIPIVKVEAAPSVLKSEVDSNADRSRRGFAPGPRKRAAMDIEGVPKCEERSSVGSEQTVNSIDKMKMQIQEYCQKFIKGKGQKKEEISPIKAPSSLSGLLKPPASVTDMLATAPVPSPAPFAPPRGPDPEPETLTMFRFLSNQVGGLHDPAADAHSEATVSAEAKKAKLLMLVQHIMLLETLLKNTKRELLVLERNLLAPEPAPAVVLPDSASQSNPVRPDNNFVDYLSIFSKNDDRLY
eukprot:TRINITY_DN11817_c0_g1_i1.p1 TRINITY_DN11817_c0_g1~~TRINITY_DN11817_c0_g1_i1.p1  ORF type:complete len:556 (-),score=120.23 TRINITY_DN11817_c0_g1_i1:140-1807(-)